ncbi:MAG: hypothetical protein LAQ30_32185 [Acidobacteriia bacterium]|nr:hypothetical protein [Terriglobia bacterium]
MPATEVASTADCWRRAAGSGATGSTEESAGFKARITASICWSRGALRSIPAEIPYWEAKPCSAPSRASFVPAGLAPASAERTASVCAVFSA